MPRTPVNLLVDPDISLRLGVVAALRAAHSLSQTWVDDQDTGTDLGVAMHAIAGRIHAGIGTVLKLAADEDALARVLLDMEDPWLEGGSYCDSGACGRCTGCLRIGWPYPQTPDIYGTLAEAAAMRSELLDPKTTASHFESLGITVTTTVTR